MGSMPRASYLVAMTKSSNSVPYPKRRWVRVSKFPVSVPFPCHFPWNVGDALITKFTCAINVKEMHAHKGGSDFDSLEIVQFVIISDLL
jgi:hypothetical protein